MSPLEDVDAYLARIGLAALAGLAELHRAHATSIAFENLDSFAGRPVSLDLAHLEDKMVARRRGGYCFEHNLLLMAALQSLDIGEVAPMLARVRMGPDGSPRPLNHLLLRVVDDPGPGSPTSASGEAGSSIRCRWPRGSNPSSRAGATGWWRTAPSSSCRPSRTTPGRTCTGSCPNPPCPWTSR